MNLRRGGPADAPAVARVHVESWNVAYRGIMPDHVIARTTLAWRTEFWRERIAEGEGPVFVLEEGSEVTGFCHVIPSPDPDDDPRRVGHVTSLHVLPHLRGGGRGRLLLDRALAELRGRGFGECTLWVLEGNRAARAFYEKLGWRLDSARKSSRGTAVPEARYRISLRASGEG